MDASPNKKQHPASPKPVHKIEEGFTELHVLSKRGSIDKVKKLISEGCELDAVIYTGTRKGSTALHIAIEFQQTQVTKILLENGADFMLKDATNESPLHIAMKKYCAESVRLILQAYYTACSKINERIKEALVERNFPIDNNTKVDEKFLEKFKPLHFAVDFELIDVMPILIENGTDIRAKDSYGMTALHWAVKHTLMRCRATNDHDAPPPRLINIIDLLLKAGSDINALDNLGKTPIFYLYKTIMIPNVDVASVLRLKDEVDNLRNDLISRFISLSARLDIRDFDGNTILHLLAKAGYGLTNFHAEVDILGGYLKSGGDLNAMDAYGHTILYYACGNGHVNLLMILLNLGVDVNLTSSKDMKRPIHRAIEFLQQRSKFYPRFEYDLIGELLKHGAYVDAAMKDGTTPIQLATRVDDYPSYESVVTCLFDWDCGEDTNLMEVFMVEDESMFSKALLKKFSKDDKHKKFLPLQARMLNYIVEKFGPPFAGPMMAELYTMKNVLVDERTMLYDILDKSPKDLVNYLSHDQLIDIMANASVNNAYPSYRCLLQKKIRHAIKREILCKDARDTLLLMFKLDIPHVYERIISQLKNNDLINLIETKLLKTTAIKYKNKEELSCTDIEHYRLHIAVKSRYLL